LAWNQLTHVIKKHFHLVAHVVAYATCCMDVNGWKVQTTICTSYVQYVTCNYKLVANDSC
jgi:hypothetical protein